VEEFGDHQIEGFVIEERLVDPPTERPGIVQRGVEDVRVFGEDILPVAHPVISGAWISEEAVDQASAFGGVLVREEGFDLGFGGDDAEGVEGDSSQEGEVVGEGGEGGWERTELGPDGTFVDPLFEKLVASVRPRRTSECV
jgi:hypothetical protein